MKKDPSTTSQNVTKTTRLLIEVLTHACESHRSEEEFGDWSEYWSMGLGRVLKCDSPERPSLKGDYDALTLNQDVQAGDAIHVLTMTYSTGDSFGRAEGKMEVVWADPRREMIEKMKSYIENHQGEHTWILPFEDGIIELSNPGSGCFEHIDSIDITTVTVEPAPGSSFEHRWVKRSGR